MLPSLSDLETYCVGLQWIKNNRKSNLRCTSHTV